MSTLTLTWPQVALLIALILAVYAAEMIFFYWRLRKHHFTERLALVRLQNLEKAVEALHRSLGEHADGGAPTGAKPRAAAAETDEAPRYSGPSRLPMMHEQTTESDQAAEGASPYALAIELARTGADASRLARDCGLSRGEADLIVSLYGRSNQK